MLARFLPAMLRAMASGRLGTADAVADGDDPARAVGLQAHQARPLELDAHDRFAVRAALERGAADRLGGVFASSAARSILAALSNTSHSMSARWNTAAGVCSYEREFDAQAVAGLVHVDDDRRVRIGRRQRAPVAAGFAGGCGAAVAASFGAGLAGGDAMAAATGGAAPWGGGGALSAALTGGGAGATGCVAAAVGLAGGALPACGGTAGATGGAAAAGGGTLSACGAGAAASLAGTVSGGAMPGNAEGGATPSRPAGTAAACLGLATCLGLASCSAALGLAPSWPTSTTMLRSSRKVRTFGSPLSVKVTVDRIVAEVGVDRSSASAALPPGRPPDPI